MSRIPLPFFVSDFSAFAKTLRTRLAAQETPVSHVTMLNLIANAGGYRNFQHLKAQQTTDSPGPKKASQPMLTHTTPRPKRITQTTRLFDTENRLIRWPKKDSIRCLCLWVIWSRIPAKTVLTEPEINTLLNQWHLFGDHALLRRELVDRNMAERTENGRQYRRREQRPPQEAVAVFEHLRRGGPGTPSQLS